MSGNNTNCVFVSGRLTGDPKLYDTSGEKVCAILPLVINPPDRRTHRCGAKPSP